MKTYVIGDVHGRLRQLKALIASLDYDPNHDRLIFLGDLIDRGEDSPGVVAYVLELRIESPHLVCLRGNHEQMLLDLIEHGDLLWLVPENGGAVTVAQYGCKYTEETSTLSIQIPGSHLEFFYEMLPYFEDELAYYVHAGLTPGKHPSECDEETLRWKRDPIFFKNYTGKLCFFGHTPTKYLPQAGLDREHGIYISGTAIGIDTGCGPEDPLSCVRVNDLTVYQSFPDGRIERYQAKLKQS
ncbi:MAG: metallophosphoesterase family protein [Acidobacteriota bacterium]|nr:serine/threonine protein phosphatase [Blastocatellia bacterium]MDW8412809.1 metallophosphoesterase family protein [Acidobacteriota bacterium]